LSIIESYNFGHMVIDGTNYTKDVIIYPDGSILTPWWRNRSHVLEVIDLESLIARAPEIIICGTGAMGFLRPSAAIIEYLRNHNIDFIAQKNSKAIKTYNQLPDKRKVGGCFHLTC